MFCPHKNSYLQLVCAVNPRIINKAVDHAMQRPHFDPHTERPPAQRLESMQPSLYAPHVDITRARLGFEHVGLKIILRDLHNPDSLIQLQALHTIMDMVQISENAMFLINHFLVHRLVDLMLHHDSIVREKVCLTLTHLAMYYQGRQQMMSRPVIISNLVQLITMDHKEIRYAAGYTLRTLARDRCACKEISETEGVIDNLIKVIMNDHTGIVLLHLKTMANLGEWDPVQPLKANAFQVMLKLFDDTDPRIVSGAMDCMTQLCKHKVGRQLADDNDVTFVLLRFLDSSDIEVTISAAGLMAYTTLTTRSKWRAKERSPEITQKLVKLCNISNFPMLQLKCMQVLINLCDCPDIRYRMKMRWEKKVAAIKIRRHEEWDGTTETTTYGLKTGLNYRTMCIEKVEKGKNFDGDNPIVVNVNSFLQRLRETKQRLIDAIHWKSYAN